MDTNYLDRYRDDFVNDEPSLRRVLEESRRLSEQDRGGGNPELWDTYPRIDQPADLAITLFAHQRVTVSNMESLERVRKIKRDSSSVFMTDFGILGDIPGYGKSLSVVALILRDMMPWDIKKSNERQDIYTYNN